MATINATTDAAKATSIIRNENPEERKLITITVDMAEELLRLAAEAMKEGGEAVSDAIGVIDFPDTEWRDDALRSVTRTFSRVRILCEKMNECLSNEQA